MPDTDLARGRAWLEKHGYKPMHFIAYGWFCWYPTREWTPIFCGLPPIVFARLISQRSDSRTYSSETEALDDAARAVAAALAAGEIEE